MNREILNAGLTEIDITPKGQPVLCFELSPRSAIGVAMPIIARALVLSQPEIQLALITLDLMGLEKTRADALVESISIATGIPAQSVMLVCSHNRAAPVTADVVGCPEINDGYLEEITPLIVHSVIQAQANSKAAALGIGQIQMPHLVWNHRLVTRNYQSVSARFQIPENEYLHPEGPTDPTVHVITIRDEHGFPLCLLWNFAADLPIETESRISSGLPGSVQNEVDRQLKKHLPCFYLGGCGGNTSYNPEPTRAISWLAGALIAAYLDTPCDSHIQLDSRAENVVLPSRDASKLWYKEDIGLKLPQALDLYEQEIAWLKQAAKPAWRASLRLFRLGSIALVGLPGMPFVEFAETIKQNSPFAHTLVISNSHSYEGYIPTQKAFDRGAFEVWTSRSSRIDRGGGDFLVQQAIRILEEF